MQNKKLAVAVTGNIGSGKTTFCDYLSSKNYPVIKADDLSKQILATNKDVRNAIIKEFGKESFKGDEVNKKFLAEKVFSNPDNVILINSILHPQVIEETKKLITQFHKSNDIVFVEAALIYEADMEDIFDYVVLISADLDLRLNRKHTETKINLIELVNRDKNQIPDEEKKKRADFNFINDGSIKDLQKKADLLIMLLKAL
ncbi:MAG TPA: dephospho-CoA kinase [Ignavibacteriaceae bacterium]|nr:dephospho-CoA kinase [Ignavibacteriaceae bacterium]